MKFVKFIIAAVCVFGFSNALFAVDNEEKESEHSIYTLKIGEKAPAIRVAKWLRGDPVNLYKGKNSNKKLYVIFFWATWQRNISPNLMNFIMQEEGIFARDGVEFVGISKEAPSRVENFLEKYPEVDFSIGVDNQAKTYTEYMQGTKGVPMFFIFDKDKKLIWKGSPFEVNRVIIRALNGTFNAETQAQIEKYRERINKAAQMLDTKEKIFYARKILDLDPTDRIAMDIIIDNYIVKNKVDRAVNFIRSTRKKAAGKKYIIRALYYQELSLIRDLNDSQGKKYMEEMSTSYFKDFSNNPHALNTFIIVVSRDVPLPILPLNNMLKISKKGLELAEKDSYEKKSLNSYYQSLARVYYFIGKLKGAVEMQSKAIELIDKSKKDELEMANFFKSFYEEALRLNVENK